MRETNLDNFNEERRKGTKEEKEKAKRNPYPVEERRETTPDPIPVKGEQTGHYLDRVGGRGEMATGEEKEKTQHRDNNKKKTRSYNINSKRRKESQQD